MKNLVSVSQIRQSRHKVELDVLRLHNRIQLLEAEEERANKIIEDTKNKVKKIMKSRAANEQFQKDLVKAREREMKQKQANVRKRMAARFTQITPTAANSTSPSAAMGPTSPQMSIEQSANRKSLLPRSIVMPTDSSMNELASGNIGSAIQSDQMLNPMDTSVMTVQTGITVKNRQEVERFKYEQAVAIKKES